LWDTIWIISDDQVDEIKKEILIND
jgi:hypothetical protein